MASINGRITEVLAECEWTALTGTPSMHQEPYKEAFSITRNRHKLSKRAAKASERSKCLGKNTESRKSVRGERPPIMRHRHSKALLSQTRSSWLRRIPFGLLLAQDRAEHEFPRTIAPRETGQRLAPRSKGPKSTPIRSTMNSRILPPHYADRCLYELRAKRLPVALVPKV